MRPGAKSHKIPPTTKVSNINYCIDEYVPLIEHRQILREHWFHGYSIMRLASEHLLSETTIKNILYETGDRILLMAAEMP